MNARIFKLATALALLPLMMCLAGCEQHKYTILSNGFRYDTNEYTKAGECVHLTDSSGQYVTVCGNYTIWTNTPR